MSQNARVRRNPEIDILRGFAILLVLFRHSHYALPTFIKHYPMILQGTWSGVDLFFVISGFVISLSLLPLIHAYHQGTVTAGQALKAFFVRRALRLLPLSLIALATNIFFVLAWNKSGQFGNWLEIRTEILPILFYYYNYFVFHGGSGSMSWYWSLSVEEQFYALYPFFLLGLRSDRTRAWVFALAVLGITFLLRPLSTPSFESVNKTLWPAFTTPSHLRFDCILAGCLAGLLYFKGHGARLFTFARQNQKLTQAIAMISLLGVAVAGAILPRLELTSYPAILVFSSLLVLIAGTNLGLTPTFGAARFLSWLGHRSYCVYLFHMLAIHFFNEVWFRILGQQKNDLTWAQGFLGLALSLSITLILAEFLHRAIEQRGIDLGRRISDRVLAKQPRTGRHQAPHTKFFLHEAHAIATQEARKPENVFNKERQ